MKSKAYAFANAVDYSVEDLSKKVTFAETANNAKQDFSKGSRIHFKDIRVQRLAWADQYEDFGNIPAEEWFSHGWHFVCNICGATIEDVADLYVNDKGMFTGQKIDLTKDAVTAVMDKLSWLAILKEPFDGKAGLEINGFKLIFDGTGNPKFMEDYGDTEK